MRTFPPITTYYAVAFTDQLLWLLTAALSALALLRLICLKLLHPPLMAFAAMLAITLFRDIALATIPYRSHAYAVAWELTLPAMLAAQAWAAFSAYRAITGLYPRIDRFGTWLFAGSLALAALFCCGTLPWELGRIGGAEAALRSTFLLHRWIDGLAAGVLIIGCSVLLRFPSPQKRLPVNVTRHAALLACYFASSSIMYFAQNLSAVGSSAWIERCHFAFVAALYLTWTVALSRKGEESEPWPPLPEGVLAHVQDRAAFAIELVRRAAQ